MAQGDVEVAITNNNSHICASFDGTDDFLSADGDDFNYSTDIDWSFTFWLKVTDDLAAATARMFCKSSIPGGTGWFSDLTHNKFRLFTKLGAHYSAIMTNTFVFLDKWTHMAIVVDRSVGTKMYINGSEVAVTENNLENLNDNCSAAKNLQIGKLDNQSVNWLGGQMADIRMFSNKVLSATEVSQIYGSTKVTDGLTSTWNFEAKNYTDQEGNNDLTNTGTYITISDSAIQSDLQVARVGTNDHYLIWDGLHGKVGTTHIEEA
tara:strand:+ start:29 stop:817 length:789 start_codon:yes stop_codon:yes gene_type:complete